MSLRQDARKLPDHNSGRHLLNPDEVEVEETREVLPKDLEIDVL